MAPLSLLSSANQTLDNTVGALFLGAVGASLLFGITSVQAYWYFHSYPNDSLLHKCSVAILWMLDTLQLVLTVHAVYIYMVKGFGNMLGLLDVTWSIKLLITVNVVVILVVHSLYAQRVWLLGGYHRGFLKYMVASVVAGGFVVGIVLAALTYTIDVYTELGKISWAIDAALGTSTAIDFIIAAAMCFYLRKSKGSISRLNSRISMIMQYTLSTGLLTSAISLSAMFSYILLPNTFVFLALEFLTTKLYVGSFLAMLNARERTERGVSTYDLSRSDNSWHQQLKSRATSSFWSPRPTSVTTIGTPLSLATNLPPHNQPTYPWQ